ncbi:P-loop containing nucleoside triphosphate hydrolase protein [Pilobolus umbonatus]|nr:P-loop containing nucleoside triphosphate hydrolase protein [Pilobolus umbonatus]
MFLLVGLDSAHELLLKLNQDIKRELNITEEDADRLLKCASMEVYDWKLRGTTVYESALQPPSTITTGDEVIDRVLGEGISMGGITEIVGESSSGKTQLGLQLCITLQKPYAEGGQEGSAVYIYSEGKFPVMRFNQIVREYCKVNRNITEEEMKSRVHLIKITDSASQYRILAYQLPAFLEQRKKDKHKIKLVVIDSISYIYRTEPAKGDRNSRFDKMSEICDIGMRLKKLASQYEVAVVAINQVSDVPVDHKNMNSSKRTDDWMDFNLVNSEHTNIGLYIQSLTKKPVLGLAWSNSVNTRIRLARSPLMDGFTTRRVLFLEFSPYAPRTGCEIRMDESGIHHL